MRIAVSGAHATGKSTLVAELARRLPGHVVVDELYYMMVAERYAFGELPAAEDFEVMLDRSLEVLRATSTPDAIFDRCVVDYVGYLIALGAGDRAASDDRLEHITRGIASLDLIIFVPIERPDRIDVSVTEHRRLRRRVDVSLRDVLVEDSWGFGGNVLEVSGAPDDRVRQVLAVMKPNIDRRSRAARHPSSITLQTTTQLKTARQDGQDGQDEQDANDMSRQETNNKSQQAMRQQET